MRDEPLRAAHLSHHDVGRDRDERSAAPDGLSLIAWVDQVWAGLTTSVTFVDLGDGRTEVTIHQTNVPEMLCSPEAQDGFNSSLDRFAKYLISL